MLREARRPHGLHIDMVAAALKVTPQKLAALEADDIESLPDAVFARALAASVCARAQDRSSAGPGQAAGRSAARPGGCRDRTISRSLKSAAPRSAAKAPADCLLRAPADRGGAAPAGRSGPVLAPAARPSTRSARLSRAWSSLSEEGQAAVRANRGYAGLGRHVGREPRPRPIGAAGAATAGCSRRARGGRARKAEAAVGNDLIVFVARDESWITVTEAGGKRS